MLSNLTIVFICFYCLEVMRCYNLEMGNGFTAIID